MFEKNEELVRGGGHLLGKRETETETETETDLVTQLIICDKLRNLNHDIEG